MTVACGTKSAYSAGCRCWPCSTANTLWMKRYRVRVARAGHPMLQPADTTRQQLRDLEQRGLTVLEVAAAANVNPRTLSQIRTGRTRQVQPRTAAAVAHIHAEPAVSAHRRTFPVGPVLDVMAARGITRKEAERRVGRKVNWSRPTMSEETAELLAVKALGLVPALVWGDDDEQVA